MVTYQLLTSGDLKATLGALVLKTQHKHCASVTIYTCTALDDVRLVLGLLRRIH